MKPWSIMFAALLGAALVTPVSGMAAQDHHAHDAAAAPVPATRYTPDAPLRVGMRSVHQAVSDLARAESGQLGAAMTRDRATGIETAIESMFANCKLEPTPDAALHGILVPLLTSAQALKTNPADTAQVSRMRDIIAAYPRYFDDPGWDAPTAGETD